MQLCRPDPVTPREKRRKVLLGSAAPSGEVCYVAVLGEYDGVVRKLLDWNAKSKSDPRTVREGNLIPRRCA